MYQQAARIDANNFSGPVCDKTVKALGLAKENENEVLQFLGERPLHTAAMTGFIRDNGLNSPANRGSFYGYRNDRGQLEGVALIGHATLIETRSEHALQAFANVAQECSTTHMILGEQERIEEFWSFYEEGGQESRLACRELLFELRWPIEIHEEEVGLRRATLDELELIVPVQATMAFAESGVNPLDQDADGFRQRCARRIEQGRTWILVENGKLVFKADVIADTTEVIYLEGVWVSEVGRGNGYGVRCMSQLSKELLSRTKSISLLVDEKNKRAQRFYQKCGYKFVSTYDTIFLRKREAVSVGIN